MNMVIKCLFFIALFIASPVYAYKLATGSYTGDATTSRLIDISATSVGAIADFTPDMVWVKCNNTGTGVWRVAAMGTDTSNMLTGASSASSIRSFTANGFTVGSNSVSNQTGVTCYYIAIANDASNDFAAGSYTGTGTTLSITTSPAFQPVFVFVQGFTTSWGKFRTAANTSNLSCLWNAGAVGQACLITNQITALNVNGFTVGNHAGTGVSGTVYYYFAIKGSASVATGSYTGNAVDNRAIATGFQPKWVWLRTNTTAAGVCYRFGSQIGDASFPYSASVQLVDQIQAFNTTSFEVGLDNCANASAEPTFYFAIKEPSSVSGRRRTSPMFLSKR
jgi:hypothetical protein